MTKVFGYPIKKKLSSKKDIELSQMYQEDLIERARQPQLAVPIPQNYLIFLFFIKSNL